MFAKLFHKLPHSPKHKDPKRSEKCNQLNPRVILHYGIPSTASLITYDPIQRLLAIATLDGRIKVIGGDNIEGLLISPKQLPFKKLEFLQNQGFLASVSNENDVQVWDLQDRCIASTFQWQSNITTFLVFQGTNYMYLGDECGSVSILSYDAEEKKIFQLPYHILAESVSKAAGGLLLNHQSVVAVLPQPCSYGNRLLFAYGNGIIVLWDVSKDQLVLIRDEASEDEQADKEISSLCWASSDGSLLAVGYIDGDIILWNLTSNALTKDQRAEKSAGDFVELQLSTSNKRLPVIVLHWSPSRLNRDHGGQLFVYGGDEMGSAEVLTILDLDWSLGKEALKNVARVDLTLQGSFADMILLQNSDPMDGAQTTSLLILTSPGQLQFYDYSCILGLISQQEEPSPFPVQYSSVLPTTEPSLTAGRLCPVYADTKSSIALAEMAEAAKLQSTSSANDKSSKWPLSGGVPCHVALSGNISIERLYIAGYQDGSVRVWDATYPVLSPLFTLGPEVKGIAIVGATASVSALEFASRTLTIAVGSESGLVRLYMLTGSCNETGLHVVTESKKEVHILNQGNGPHCFAAFSLCTSPVSTLKFSTLGDKLALGFNNGQVAMLDISSLSVLFLSETHSGPNSPVISFALGNFLDICGLNISLEQCESDTIEPPKQLAVVLRRDSHIAFLNATKGSLIISCSLQPKELTAISMYILESTKIVLETEAYEGKHYHLLSAKDDVKSVSPQVRAPHEGSPAELLLDMPTKDAKCGQITVDWLVLICCTDVLLVFPLKSLIQGDSSSIHEVNLVKTCCWTSTFKKEEKELGLVVFYQTGLIEIRSLPNLEVLGEYSLMSVLRWNFKSNMDKTMSSTDNGQIALVNGCEFAIMSLLASENDFRIPQSLPCLHDEVLAAAMDNDINFFPNKQKNKETVPWILSGLVKGFRTNKEASETHEADDSSLERVYSRSSKQPSAVATNIGEAVELSIDDIEIDEPVHVSPLPYQGENENKEKKTEREILFEGATSESKPRQRTVEEIKAKYRKAGDASAAASHARDKLVERGEKLERISERSEELRSGAESFASLAQELARRMENRKWWQL
ncbi:hypothetical protein Nepgr_032396 [Nepenthes gracilis]|uniref:V-SNARE coiled-coil homology domain-containing protein n=1 Tax=Nepenthes gracilis TaxID=150966 RepID=A0AAD3Y606_NEPGR|nr:hypothetical protein Nepgr_032396 [Nepenthes gracilis]